MATEPGSLGQVCLSFPLTNLPTDAQLLILTNMDLHTIQNIVNAIPNAKVISLNCPSTIIHGVQASMEFQTRNFLLTT
jgi:hypothetical protein